MRYKNEEKDYKRKNEYFYFNEKERIQKTRLHLTIQPSEHLKLKTRAEYVFVNGIEREHGLLLFQDFQYNIHNKNINLSIRQAWFHSTDYAARIYAYENDVLYAFSIPPYYGKGFRQYFYIHHKITKKLEWWLKIANTFWTDRNTVGSGYYEIAGNTKTELKIQLRLKF